MKVIVTAFSPLSLLKNRNSKIFKYFRSPVRADIHKQLHNNITLQCINYFLLTIRIYTWFSTNKNRWCYCFVVMNFWNPFFRKVFQSVSLRGTKTHKYHVCYWIKRCSKYIIVLEYKKRHIAKAHISFENTE